MKNRRPTMDSSGKVDDAQSFSSSRDGDNNRPKLFEKIVYFASGSIGDEALSALKSSNAESTCLLSDSVTHCIVGVNHVEADVSAARELYDVTTVTPEWIRMSVLCNKLLPTKPFNPFEDNIFNGITVCVSQLTANDCKTLWALVTFNGGIFRLTLDLYKTTHLVVTKPSGKKYDAVVSNGTDKIKIVTPDWIIDCLKNKEICSETHYHPRLLVLPKLPPTNQSFKIQTSGLSTITGFADFDAPVEQPGTAVPKNQGLEQLKQRLPWNQPSTPPTSQPVQVQPTQVSQGTTQSNNNTQPKPMMSLISTPQLQRLSQQQVQQLQLQQQTHASNQLLQSQQQLHSIPQQQNQFQQQIRTQQIQQSKQVQLQHGQQLQFQSNQQQMQQQNHLQIPQGQQTHLQMLQKSQQQNLQQNQQHIQMQQKLQQLQNQQQQQQQNVQLQQSQSQQNVSQLQPNQQSNPQLPQLQQQTQPIQQGQLSQLQQQTIQLQQGQQQQQQVQQISQLQQQQTVQLQQGQQQQGQLSQLQKQTVQIQQNQQHSNQLQQGQQIQSQQVPYQTGNGQQVQFSQQQVAQNTQVHVQQQQQQLQQQQQPPQLQNVQSSQPSQICIVSNSQPIQQTQSSPVNQQQQQQQQLLIQQQQQRLMFQQRIVQQGGGTVSAQWRMAHPPSNMPRVQVNPQQPQQQQQQQQTLVIGQQQTVNMNTANGQPTTQTQWPQQQTLTIQRTIQQPLDQRQVIWSQQSPHGPQQMIHMDAKTHQQIQAMNPAERLAFINKLTKQRHLVLQQFNARQQQAAGVTGGTNIIRPSTPNGQTTVIRTLNHQLISTSGMTQAQQAQWNQIRQQQLIAQQQQQQQQQMAGGTVTSGLPTNVKTVNNTLVNNQQVVQPQTTVWQQTTVTEQGHQQAAGNMSATQIAQLHQRQQLQQMRLQQLQMDATQKQQTMQQQVVPNQPIPGGMPPNVVQSPQVATPQTSIVQPQQTPALPPTNEQSDTQSSSQESFAQMSGQEISAAGQLRLMTAQHHAAQHQNQPQGSVQGTYQSRAVLNNVTNNGASNRAAQVVGRATVQTAVANKSLPANYNQSAAVRVAAVLAKSAAGQTVGHQQIPHQARFFGHNPNLKLPPDKCLLGCVFLIVEYDRYPDTMNDVSTWKQIILDHGGEIEPSYSLRLTHILCQTQKHPLVQQGLRDGKRCITAYWLSDIIIKQQLMPPWYALHFPTPYSEERPCRHMLISLTNFENEERNRVKFMIELTGARVTSYFSADNNILVTRKLEGKKVKKARDSNRPVVNVQWLNEILFGHLSCMYQPENAKYQQFNLNNPFRVDYNLVLHLMGAWKTPINVTQELYDRIRNNPVPVKRKRPRPSLPDFIDQENNDLSTADIIITNINPPPIEFRPCIMLSGFGLAKEEQRMVLQLGGTIAKKYANVTHLVMKDPVRTTKFLCCVSTVKHIVTAEWLKDSSTQHMFLGEAIYTIEEISVDQQVICKIHKVLANPNRHELFKGKIFYVTPGVTRPSAFVVGQIIESAGGTVEKQRRSLRAIQECEPNTYIVITTNNDLHLVADLIRSSYGIYSSEFVLSAVMTQYINYDMAFKKPKKIIN